MILRKTKKGKQGPCEVGEAIFWFIFTFVVEEKEEKEEDEEEKEEKEGWQRLHFYKVN